jgi:putative hydrolases of HD superfamily
MDGIEDWMKIRRAYQLKKVYRMNSNGKRKESSAEHSWSAILLADYILSSTEHSLKKERVVELLIYHDLVEVISGDIPFHETTKRLNKAEDEKKAAKQLKKGLPQGLGEKFYDCFMEFENMKTPEAKFAKAIDKLDAEIHELDYKKDWKGWTPEKLKRLVEEYYKGIPNIEKIFEELIEYTKKNGYYDQ